MANEKRLIDANAMREDWLENGENEYVYDTNAVLDSIDAQPTVDAVEVVRCKDCAYFRVEPDDFLGVCKCGAIATNYGGEIYPEREHFCSYGERRTGDG